MLCYTGLAAEFLFRVYYRKPFQRGDAPESTEAPNDKSWRADGGYLPFRISLMVLGLTIATVFVFVRFVVSLLSFMIHSPPAHVCIPYFQDHLSYHRASRWMAWAYH